MIDARPAPFLSMLRPPVRLVFKSAGHDVSGEARDERGRWTEGGGHPDGSNETNEQIHQRLSQHKGPEYGRALRALRPEVQRTYLEWDGKRRRSESRSRAAARGAATRARRQNEREATASTPTGKRMLDAQAAIENLGQRMTVGADIKDQQWDKATQELENASLAHRLYLSHTNPDVVTQRRNSSAPELTLDSGPDPTQATRDPNTIPWTVTDVEGRPELISGAEIGDSPLRNGERVVTLYGIHPGTMPNDSWAGHRVVSGAGGVYMLHFDGGDPEISRRARRLIWHIAHGRARDASIGELEAMIRGGTTKSIRLPWLTKQFNESQHPRSHGQFSRTPGGAGAGRGETASRRSGDRKPGPEYDRKPADLSGNPTKAARSLLGRLSSVPAKMRSGTIAFVHGKYKQLEEKYGRKGAIAIIGASVLLAAAPVPFSSLIPIALAEAFLVVKRAVAGKGMETPLDAETVEHEARALLKALWAHHGETREDDGEDVPAPRPKELVWLWEVRKAFDESKHPRDDHGRWVDKEQLQQARSSPALAAILRRRVTRPSERKKLDAHLANKPASESRAVKLSEQGMAAVKKITPTKSRAFAGKPTGGKISKQLAGAIGEAIIIRHLQSLGFKDAGQLSGFVGTEKNNLPVDLIHDHRVVEVKTGQASNSESAQQWRLTIGEPGEKEKAWLATASKEAKAKWNAKKQAKIHARKKQEIAKLEKKLGYTVKGTTMTVIINPDTKTADIYQFDGFHDRIAWRSEQANAGYVGSVRYG